MGDPVALFFPSLAGEFDSLVRLSVPFVPVVSIGE